MDYAWFTVYTHWEIWACVWFYVSPAAAVHGRSLSPSRKVSESLVAAIVFSGLASYTVPYWTYRHLPHLLLVELAYNTHTDELL